MRAPFLALAVAALLAPSAAVSHADVLKALGAVKAFHAPVVDLANIAVRENPEGTTYTPTVLMHGMGDAGHNDGMQSLAQSIMKAYNGSYAVAVDVADGVTSFIIPIAQQAAWLAEVVRADPKLAGGFNLVGLSQGGLIARAYIEMFNDPPVKNFVSICGTQNGVFDCPLELRIIPFLCDAFKADPYHFLLNGTIPIVFQDYFVTFWNQQGYLSGNRLLPELNNEVQTANSSIYKARFSSLNQLLLIGATQDEMVYPWQSEQFGGYDWTNGDEKTEVMYNYTQGAQYQQDLIGVRTLDEAGKVLLSSFDGGHLQFSDQYWDQVILPWLQ